MGVRWRRGLSAGVTAVVAVGVIGVPAPEPVAAAAPECAEVASTEVEASALATSCGQPVVVDSSRTEFAEVTALPDGRMQFTSAVVPQRTRKANRWADIDLDLARSEDGRWRPAVSVADVAFSGGGNGPLVTLTRAGRTVTLSWPRALPAPTVSGDSLTYPDVLADVDLVVRATRTGFTHALVVKTPAATRLPEVRAPRFRLGGDTQVVRGPDGGLRALSGTAVVASAEPAVMWDSRMETTADVSARGFSATSQQSTATAAGDAARTGKVDVEISGDDLVLRPDVTLLDDPDAVFPLFVDPAWSVSKNKWAYGTNNGSSNSDRTVARVGLNPDTGALYRSYFEFPMTANGVSLKGKQIHIESAYVQMKLDHSWSCTPTVASMYLTPAINATPKAGWSAMSLKKFLKAKSGNANEAGGCSSIQPDMIMNFDGAAVRDQMQAAAAGSWTAFPVAFTARASDGSGESTQSRWKKFHPNDAKLFVDYDTKPGAPHSLQVAGVACGSGVLTIGTLTPKFAASFPDADKSDSLTGTFEWIEVPAGGMGAVTDTSPSRKSPPPAKTGITPNSRAETSAVTITKGPTYAFRARGKDKAPYSQTGPWSAWCRFVPDTTVPPAPTITPGSPGGPGKTMTFTFSTTTKDVTKFRYGWSSPPTTEITASGTTTKTATVTVTVPRFGENTLWVRGIDATGNLGNIGSASFIAPRPAPAIAKWGLEQYPGVDQPASLADQQPTLGGRTDLTAANVTWTDDVRMIGGKAASLNGTSSVLTTPGSVINTANSFSVAAWVRLGALPTTTDMVVASQTGANAGGFHLGTRLVGSPATPRWSFLMKDTDDQASTTRPAYTSTALTSADVGRWTHIAGVFDKAAGKVRLYVNGELAAETDRSVTPWNATGAFAVGRGWSSGAASNWFHGNVADVQVYDRVLVPHDFTGQLAQDPTSGGFDEPGMLTPVQVGNWNFEAATPCYLENLKDTCEAPDTVTAWGRWLALTKGSAVGAGYSTDGSGLWLDYEYFPEEGYTEGTAEYARSAVKTGITPPNSDGLEFTQWQDKPVLRTDQSFTMSAWVMLDRLDGMRSPLSQRGQHSSGGWLKYNSTLGKWHFAISDEDLTTTPTASITSTSAAEEGVWTHLAGVYDAERKQIRLYVNGELEGVTQNLSFTPMPSTGPLLVGRTLWQGQLVDQWTGGIDDVAVFQGALTDASVSLLYNS